MGHRVFTSTQTGLGERRHLLAPTITLDTFIADLVNAIEAEELDDVVLVGHSFAGTVISGCADRMPERVRHLVYLDSTDPPLASIAPSHRWVRDRPGWAWLEVATGHDATVTAPAELTRQLAAIP